MKIDVGLVMELEQQVFLEGEIVDVAPHLAHIATFIVHPLTRQTRYCVGGFGITNVETGRGIIECDAETRKGCIAKAKTFLADKTEAGMLKVYRLSGIKP